MKITNIETYPADIVVKPELAIKGSRGAHRVSPFLIVRVDTDEGISGAGEATTMPRWSGETSATADSMIQELLAPALIGQDPLDVETLDAIMDRTVHHNWFTKAAIEMACWDIRGLAEGKPVYELLGGPHRSNVIPARFSMAAYDPETAASKAAERVGWGFTTIKVKVGTVPEEDIARVKAVREAIGPDLKIVVDANCGWDCETAIRCCKELEDCNLSLIEQPTPDGDYDAITRLKNAVDVPVMADDMCFDLVHARELIRNKGCDVISVYPGKNGGIRKSAEIVKLAAEHGIACSIGSNLEWDVSTAAMGHLVIGLENMNVEEYPGDILGPWYHEDRIVTEPLKIEGNTCTIPDKPGLGVTVDWDKMEKYRAAKSK